MLGYVSCWTWTCTAKVENTCSSSPALPKRLIQSLMATHHRASCRPPLHDACQAESSEDTFGYFLICFQLPHPSVYAATNSPTVHSFPKSTKSRPHPGGTPRFLSWDSLHLLIILIQPNVLLLSALVFSDRWSCTRPAFNQGKAGSEFLREEADPAVRSKLYGVAVGAP